MSMRGRITVLALAAVLLGGCGTAGPGDPSLKLPAGDPLPSGAVEVTEAPNQRGDISCDPTASLRPGNQPRAGAMPAGSSMAAIVQRGKLRVGVDQNQYLFGFRNPVTGQLEGFDIDIAREVAQDLFGDPEKIELHPIDAAHRVPALTGDEVDIVVQNFTATCVRRQDIQFSSTYFVTDQRILTTKGSSIRNSGDLAGKRVCAVFRTTTMDAIFALNPRPTVIGMSNWLDCLTAMQQGQVDAVSTDLPILYGLKEQDPNLEIVGEAMAFDSYAIGVQKKSTDMVRFVNGVLERIRGDGTWTRLYNARLTVLGPAPGPPAAKYSE